MISHFVFLLGKDRSSPEIQVAVTEMNEPPLNSQITDRVYLVFKANGISFGFDEFEKLQAVYLYSEGWENFHQFQGALPANLTFTDSLQSVRNKLGQPTRWSGPKQIPILGTSNPWDRFDFHDYKLHVEYKPDFNSVNLVTILAPSFDV